MSRAGNIIHNLTNINCCILKSRLLVYLRVNCPVGKLDGGPCSAPFSTSRSPDSATPPLTISLSQESTSSVSPNVVGSSRNLTCLIGLTRLTMMTETVESAIQAHPTRVQVFGNSLKHHHQV